MTLKKIQSAEKISEMLVTVHQLLLCPNISSACQVQLRLFAAQIVDNEFQFTACGIVPLDQRFPICAPRSPRGSAAAPGK